MFKKLSYKVKWIIFILCILISIAICFDYVKSRKIIKNPSNKEQSTNIKKDENNKSEEEIKKEEEKQKKQQALEEKYKNAYDLFHSKKYAEAIKVADEIIIEDKDNYKAHNIKGISLCFLNNFDEGMKNIDNALAIKGDYGYARFNKALAYELYEKLDDALIWYDKALEVENYIWSFYGKASIYGRRGDVTNTVKYLKIAISMDSSVKAIAKEESDFNPVKNSEEFQAIVR